jgi:hypothetical protein
MQTLQQRSLRAHRVAGWIVGGVMLAMALGQAAAADEFPAGYQSAAPLPSYSGDAGQTVYQGTPAVSSYPGDGGQAAYQNAPAAAPGSVPPAAAPAAAAAGATSLQPTLGDMLLSPDWNWQALPSSLIYHSYLAGPKEPRMASQWVYEKNGDEFWDAELGGRVGILRYGTDDPQHPQGWELDIEGACFPRLNMREAENLQSCDYRFGTPFSYGYGNYQMKFGYFHICSHLGDQFILSDPGYERVQYVRNALVWGHSYNWTPDLRIYGEASWAFEYSGAAKAWEIQFGIEYSPAGPTGWCPKPFVAVNTDLHQEDNFGGNLVFETGLQWRGEANHLFRLGVQYFTGKSDQDEFYDEYEEKFGLALWYDF